MCQKTRYQLLRQSTGMGHNFDKFVLLMWKNWILQRRKPIQTFIEIIAPVIFSILLVIIRCLVVPTYHDSVTYNPFCTLPVLTNEFQGDICTLFYTNASLPSINSTSNDSVPETFGNMTLIYSPIHETFNNTMNFFHLIFKNVIGFKSASDMENYFMMNTGKSIFAAIQFDNGHNDINKVTDLQDLTIIIRFPGETRSHFDVFGDNNWKTNLIYPSYQVAGPRSWNVSTGAAPSYFSEGFLAIQHLLTTFLILTKNGFKYPLTNNSDIISWMLKNKMPIINMRRFPYADWFDDLLLPELRSKLGLIIMLSFAYSSISIVKAITIEKQKQLKETMKIMGLSNWLHWTAWFAKCFIFLLISAILMIILLKVKWYPNMNHTVFTKSDPLLMLLFLTIYICSTITFCFAISVFFSNANTAATFVGLAWYLIYTPFIFMQNSPHYSSMVYKVLTCLGSNTAMAFGFHIIQLYEGIDEGAQWDNIFSQVNPNENLTLGLAMGMLLFDCLLYLLIAMYVQLVYPGEYGIPQPWYYPFTYRFWFGQSKNLVISKYKPNTSSPATQEDFFETEPYDLQPGIQIKNLQKVFGKKIAVNNLTLNIYEDQILVLLGHNGAGKTTTMSILTGFYVPTSGTAIINNYDIRSNMEEVRQSLGLCPQHNVLFDELTVEEHLYFYSKLKGLDKLQVKKEIDKYILLLELESKRNMKSSTLSGGMKRKLCVANAFCGNSKVVILDEPSAGLDPLARRSLWSLIQNQKEGRTILLSTHFLDEADLLGDRIAILAGGKLQCCGSSLFLKKKYGVGYRLTMDKAQECNPTEVTDLLRRFISSIEVYSNIGSELVYLLPEKHSSVFESMLKELETNSQKLHIRSYGISLRTLEEVFTSICTNNEDEKLINDEAEAKKENGKFITESIDFDDKKLAADVIESDNNNGGSFQNTGDEAFVLEQFHKYNGCNMVINHIMAMAMKRVLSTIRSWILLILQIIIPVVFLVISILVLYDDTKMGNLPAMTLSLDNFPNAVTLTENKTNFDYFKLYIEMMNNSKYKTNSTDDIISVMIALTKEDPNLARVQNIIGDSFTDVEISPYGYLPLITAWFNNDVYHSPGTSLALVLNMLYKKFGNCTEECSLNFINYPMPYSTETQIKQIFSEKSMGFHIAFTISFSMAFVSSFYILFIVRENICKSKHLQLLSGANICIFWIINAIFDMLLFLLTVIVLLITLMMFQEGGFKTFYDLERMFLILVCFGWAFLPMNYVAGYFFDTPTTGYARMTLFNLFTGNATFLLVQIMVSRNLGLENIGKTLHWIFLLFPHYALASAINDGYIMYGYNTICFKILKACLDSGNTPLQCKHQTMSDNIKNICEDADLNYFKWKAPGISRNFLFLFVEGALFFIILMLIEYKIFQKINCVHKNHEQENPNQISNEDSDVLDEKKIISDLTESEITQNYSLVIRNLSRYYKKILAVNQLHLGVKKFECFGLLGVNGAGKTTTFKMLTGDVNISSGEAWVNGHSLKQNLKNIHNSIGYCPQFDALLDDMTARETIIMFSLIKGVRLNEMRFVAENLAWKFGFFEHLDKKIKELSGGNKRKVSTAIALIGDPPVIYLDEPTAGMDVMSKRRLWKTLCNIRDSGKCIVLTSHSMEECEALCTRLAIMVNGSFRCLGSTQHLKSKFAEGYTLTIKMKKTPEIENKMPSTSNNIEEFVKKNFPSAELREFHQDLLTYYITDTTVPWSKMFGILERSKNENLNIEDYSLGQSSLEQVFLTFTKQQ